MIRVYRDLVLKRLAEPKWSIKQLRVPKTTSQVNNKTKPDAVAKTKTKTN